jgi:hypothetical protein
VNLHDLLAGPFGQLTTIAAIRASAGLSKW